MYTYIFTENSSSSTSRFFLTIRSFSSMPIYLRLRRSILRYIRVLSNITKAAVTTKSNNGIGSNIIIVVISIYPKEYDMAF